MICSQIISIQTKMIIESKLHLSRIRGKYSMKTADHISNDESNCERVEKDMKSNQERTHHKRKIVYDVSVIIRKSEFRG